MGKSGPPYSAVVLAATGGGRFLEHSVEIRNAETGDARLTIRNCCAGRVTAVVFSPDGQRLAAATDDGVVRQWDVRTGLPVWDPPVASKSP